MTYKGYEGVVQFDEEAGIFHGDVINTRDVITFQGTSVDEIQTAFRESVDDYLAFCAERGEEPEKPFSGNFMVRIDPDLHRQIAISAKRCGKSLNSYMGELVKVGEAQIGQGPSRTTARRAKRRASK